MDRLPEAPAEDKTRGTPARDRFGEALDRASTHAGVEAAPAASAPRAADAAPPLRVVEAQATAAGDRMTAALQRAAAREEGGFANGDAAGLYGARPPISYTRTRVLKIDPARLEAVRIILREDDPWGLQSSHKLLRTRLLHQMRANGWRTLGVISARANPGRTLLACNLAVGMAQEADLTALLVDADLRAPSIAGLFGLPAGPGFAGVVTRRAALADALVHASVGDPGPELVILAGGQPVVGAAELMGSPAVAGLVREIAERYDDRMVVFDLPPLLAGADCLAFLPNVDATLLVVEERGTAYDDLEHAQELLAPHNLLGVVLDKATGGAPAQAAGQRPGRLARLLSRIGL